jgi:hypothetical protein
MAAPKPLAAIAAAALALLVPSGAAGRIARSTDSTADSQGYDFWVKYGPIAGKTGAYFVPVVGARLCLYRDQTLIACKTTVLDKKHGVGRAQLAAPKAGVSYTLVLRTVVRRGGTTKTYNHRQLLPRLQPGMWLDDVVRLSPPGVEMG